MSSEHQKIIKRYPTEKHKRFFFPIRPLFTLGSGLFFGALFLAGLMPGAWAIIFTAAFAFDDLPLAPFIKLIRAANNLASGRKKLKSIVMITTILLSALAGGLIAFLFLIHNPTFMFGIGAFLFGTGCSPIWIFMGGVLGAIFADLTGKVTPLFGIAVGFSIGFIIGFCLPATAIPMAVSAIFIASVSAAFIGSVLAKQALRFYHYCRYGHSNADGYNMDCTPEEQEAFVAAQAQKFNVSKEAFQALIDHCKAKVTEIKEKASFTHAVKETSWSNPFETVTWCWDEFTLKRNYSTNAYKDIYHGLMARETTPETIQEVKILLKASKPSEYDTHKERPSCPWAFTSTRQSNLQARTFFHQTSLADGGGIQESLIEPFLQNAGPGQ